MTYNKFNRLPIGADILANLDSMGYAEMTPIQIESLPHILDKKDVIAQAKTGSGKTAAFGIGIITHLDIDSFYVQALVLCPTRELADQVAKEIRRLARFTHNIKVVTLCGGTPSGPQKESLSHGAHIIVGTPGRILDHIKQRSLKLGKVSTLVLDEADRMLDMGFAEDIAEIINVVPRQRQTLLFSATYPDGIKEISKSYQKSPITISVDTLHSEGQIEQYFFEVEKSERAWALMALLIQYEPESSIVFCTTKIQCQELALELHKKNFSVLAIHGDLEQRERDEILTRFTNKSVSILIATDVAARGLDIKDLQAVINFELSRDPEIHVHRIGRTGRAGKKGLVLNLFTKAEEKRVNAIATYQNLTINKQQIDRKKIEKISNNKLDSSAPLVPPMITLQVGGGKKRKIRPGDILGALTSMGGVTADQVGKINVFDYHTLVAIDRLVAKKALYHLQTTNIKGCTLKVRLIESTLINTTH